MDLNILIAGNPLGGFTFTGPFDDPEYAAHWAESTCGDWWSVHKIGPIGKMT